MRWLPTVCIVAVSTSVAIAACDSPNPADGDTLPYLIVQLGPTAQGATALGGAELVDIQAGVPDTLPCSYFQHSSISLSTCARDSGQSVVVGQAKIQVRAISATFHSVFTDEAPTARCFDAPLGGSGVLTLAASIDGDHPSGSVLEVALVAKLVDTEDDDAGDAGIASHSDAGVTVSDAAAEGGAESVTADAGAATVGAPSDACSGYAVLVTRSLLLAPPLPVGDGGPEPAGSDAEATDAAVSDAPSDAPDATSDSGDAQVDDAGEDAGAADAALDAAEEG